LSHTVLVLVRLTITMPEFSQASHVSSYRVECDESRISCGDHTNIDVLLNKLFLVKKIAAIYLLFCGKYLASSDSALYYVFRDRLN
jgi:hypothetical protein